jgi:hypothetical protein
VKLETAGEVSRGTSTTAPPRHARNSSNHRHVRNSSMEAVGGMATILTLWSTAIGGVLVTARHQGPDHLGQ